MSTSSPTTVVAPTKSRVWLGIWIMALAVVALSLEFWMLPGLRFWDPKSDAFNRAVVAYEKGDFTSAIPLFTEVTRRRPKFSAAYNYRALCYHATKQNRLALVDFEKAIELSPASPIAYYNRGRLHFGERNYREAIADFNASLARGPRRPPTLISRGAAYRFLGEDGNAFADFAEAIQLAPNDASGYMARGKAYGDIGEFAKEHAEYRKAIEVEPENSRGHNGLAWLLSTCPQVEFRDGRKAIEYATNACKLSGWTNFAHLDTLAAAYAEAGEFDQAVQWQTQCLEEKSISEEMLAEAKARLALYQAKTPYRTSAPR